VRWASWIPHCGHSLCSAATGDAVPLCSVEAVECHLRNDFVRGH
jgi:hypothetical protein